MSYFSIEGMTQLSSVPKGSHIHLIGVSGIAMAQLAVALQQSGYVVSGSDIDFWEPSGSLLRNSKVTIQSGYEASHITDSINLVVIGNAIRADNPEVREVENKKLSYTCFPKILHEVVIANKTSIVISGTHGKSTTSALTAWCLSSAELRPGFFIGGSVQGLTSSLVKGEGNISVVEGDEYDSAFFAKIPKFDFYSPEILLVTSVEFDHADIYSSIDAINTEFTDLINSMPRSGAVIVSDQGANLKALVESWKKSSKSKLLVYGTSDNADIKITERYVSEEGQEIHFLAFGKSHTIQTKLFGAYNAYNAVGSWTCQTLAGVEQPVGFDTFPGVKRRQEIRLKNESTVIIEDFAHHPTAVLETLKGIKEQFPNRELIACFEPRSNTSRRKIFQNDYANSFMIADVVYLKEVTARHNDSKENLFSSAELSEQLIKAGKKSSCFSKPEEFVSAVKGITKPKVVVVMSNGSFDGLIDLLVDS